MPIKLSQPSPSPVSPKVPTVLEQAAALQLSATDSPDLSPELETNPLLAEDEERPGHLSSYADRDLPYGLSEKLAAIESILSAGGKIPVDTLRLACKHVMLCLKQNEDSILALEPEDQQLIVQGYLEAASTVTQEVLKPKKKKATKRKIKEIAATPLAPEEEEF